MQNVENSLIRRPEIVPPMARHLKSHGQQRNLQPSQRHRHRSNLQPISYRHQRNLQPSKRKGISKRNRQQNGKKQASQPKELVNQHISQESATPPQRPAPAERNATIKQAAPVDTYGSCSKMSRRSLPKNIRDLSPALRKLLDYAYDGSLASVPQRTAPQCSTVNQRRSQRVVERLETSKVAAKAESTTAQPVAVMIPPPSEQPQVAVIPPPPEPEPEPELPYALEDLPEVLRKIKNQNGRTLLVLIASLENAFQ